MPTPPPTTPADPAAFARDRHAAIDAVVDLSRELNEYSIGLGSRAAIHACAVRLLHLADRLGFLFALHTAMVTVLATEPAGTLARREAGERAAAMRELARLFPPTPEAIEAWDRDVRNESPEAVVALVNGARVLRFRCAVEAIHVATVAAGALPAGAARTPFVERARAELEELRDLARRAGTPEHLDALEKWDWFLQQLARGDDLIVDA